MGAGDACGARRGVQSAMEQGVGGLDDLAGKSLLIFDDGLATRDGHWLDYDKAVAELHGALGVRTTVVCDAAFPHADELAAVGARVLPIVERSPWHLIARGISPHGPLRSLALAWHVRAILKRLLREQRYDCVLHPAAMSVHVLAWCLLPRRLRRRAGRTVFATWITLASHDAAGEPRFARRLAYWKLMGRWLKRPFASGRMALMTDSARLAREYRLLSGLPAGVMPSPATNAADLPPPGEAGESVCFGSLGPARFEKGIDILQQAIGRLLADGPAGARFIIQWNRPLHDDAGASIAPDPVLAADPRVELITEALTTEQYRALLARITCMVLPYRRSAYFARGSAVAVEAACAAMPMIYTADTWIADFAERQGAGIAVPDGDAGALARAMADMAERFAHFRQLARERAPHARAANAPEGFARALWGLAA
jgi:glycosyltransferase involved in cell wall biosynthesis